MLVLATPAGGRIYRRCSLPEEMGAAGSVPVLRVCIEGDSPLPNSANCIRTRLCDLKLPANLLPASIGEISAVILCWGRTPFKKLPENMHYVPGYVNISNKVPVYTASTPDMRQFYPNEKPATR